jgi:transcriptional regulator with XRE-family HTH domain
VKKQPKRTYYVNKPALLLIGNKIRAARTAKGVSIENLAYSSGIDYSQLAKMELGQVNFSISYLFRVAEALGVTPRELLP